MRIFLILLIICFVSCHESNTGKKNETNKNEVSCSTSEFDDKVLINNLIDLALIKGDTNSYNLAFRHFIDSGHYDEFLCNSITMSIKFNYSKAYFDTYYLLKLEKENDLFKQNLSYYFLLKSYELGHLNAKDEINSWNSDSSNPKIILNSNFYKDKLKNSKSPSFCDIDKLF